MRIAVLGEPTGWHVGRLTERLRARGHAATVVRWAELAAGIDRDRESFAPAPLADADLVCVRGMPGTGGPGSRLEQVVVRMDMLGRLESRGTPIVNSPRALEAAIDKYLSLARLAAAGLPVPRTRVVQDVAAAEEAFRELGGDCVLKPLFGSRGRGLERLTHPRQLTGPLAPEGGVAYLQEFVPHGGWDVRILVVGARCFSMRRVAPPGDWRTNVSLGGRPEPFSPPGDWLDLAVRAAAVLETEIAGVDLVPAADGRALILEVNAVPAWRGLETATGLDLADAVAGHLEHVHRDRGRAGKPAT